jgi:hypothetical protein
VFGRRGCTRVETGSPGEHVRCWGAAARASLVGGTERRGGTRGAQPRSLSRASAMEGGWVAPVRLSGEAAWSVGCAYLPCEWKRGVGEDLGKILCMHGSGSSLLLLFLKNSNKIGLE